MTARLQAEMFTSATDMWGTPESFLSGLRQEFSFTLDPCASHTNAKAERYYTIEDDGLTQPWTGTVWMNPPYGRTIGAWLTKARRSAQLGATVVCLIPCRTDTNYWHDEVMAYASEVRFLRQRLNFEGDCGPASHNAPFPSVVVIFRPGLTGPPKVSTISRNGLPEVLS